jgi:hypothetical protein
VRRRTVRGRSGADGFSRDFADDPAEARPEEGDFPLEMRGLARPAAPSACVRDVDARGPSGRL